LSAAPPTRPAPRRSAGRARKRCTRSSRIQDSVSEIRGEADTPSLSPCRKAGRCTGKAGSGGPRCGRCPHSTCNGHDASRIGREWQSRLCIPPQPSADRQRGCGPPRVAKARAMVGEETRWPARTDRRSCRPRTARGLAAPWSPSWYEARPTASQRRARVRSWVRRAAAGVMVAEDVRLHHVEQRIATSERPSPEPAAQERAGVLGAESLGSSRQLARVFPR